MQIIIAALVGVALGVFSGLAPGIHVNLVCSMLLAFFPFLPFGQADAIVFIVALATTHTFLDIIPSVFLGAPDDSMALGVLPAHRYVLKGNGLMAVKLSTIGALFGLILGAISFSIFAHLTVFFELVPKRVIGFTLLAIPLVMLLKDRKKLAALSVIVLASCYGFIGFRFSEPLFPMLSGLFGAATLLYSINETSFLPEQKIMNHTDMRVKDSLQAGIGGLVAGGLTAILPGVGAAHASAIGMLLASGTGDQGYLVLTGAIGTTNFFLSLAAFDAIGKARNGALLAATTISPAISVLSAVGAALFAGGIGVIFTLWLGRRACKLMTLIPYRALTISVLCLVSLLVLVISGLSGLLLYITGCAIGLIPAATKTGRAHAMSCILIPIAWRFIAG